VPGISDSQGQGPGKGPFRLQEIRPSGVKGSEPIIPDSMTGLKRETGSRPLEPLVVERRGLAES